jgi:hypothetical protein
LSVIIIIVVVVVVVGVVAVVIALVVHCDDESSTMTTTAVTFFSRTLSAKMALSCMGHGCGHGGDKHVNAAHDDRTMRKVCSRRP